MDSQPHILVVDDHQEIRTLLQRFLTDHEYRVTTASNGMEMKKRLQDAAIDLIVLDLMMPGEDGLTLCRNLRAESNIPVIMLTAMGEETDRIIGLEMGADDYLAKPFNPRELLARIKAVMRRMGTMHEASRQELPQQLNFLGWTLRPASRELTDPQQTLVPLSTAEFTLLMAFVTRPGRVLSRDQLLDLARGREARAFDRAIDTLVSRLRRKLRDQPRNPQIIKTVRGGGYLFAAKVENNNASLA
ncbi:MAG: DNA-binding response regulator [gamma proteobacterium symbiont of Stewartia floridana]|nr:response regulator [Candidatus Thiodiazotropha taylori]RLW54383.1 MAG: DNA-binding response regulator [gamma proteobacterium symbiont of Stewartia floridana]MCG7927898.1 response regulator [Candidatus Thiodiazotropha taylori]MCG7996280.1 response regulator [Candidatus Thiodiazotropha taylori]MCG8074224.1 response regulator [Candidatus Thiodiazotropha taylori]